MFVEDGLPLEDQFASVLRRRFDAPVEALPFAAAPDACRVRINRYVAGQTDDRIPEILPAGSIDALTRLVSVSAFSFLGTWECPFSTSETTLRPFTLEDGMQMSALLMHQEATFGYAALDGVQVLDLPYRGGRFAMMFVLPRVRCGLPAVEAAMDGTTVGRWQAALEPCRVRVGLPKVNIAPRVPLGLGPVFEAMGMPTAFSPTRADFSRISPESRPPAGLYLKHVFHQTFVRIDEKGTEARAATAAVMDDRGGAPPSRTFQADHPYLFFLRDVRSGTVLFQGRVARPGSE
jgi:serpin B